MMLVSSSELQLLKLSFLARSVFRWLDSPELVLNTFLPSLCLSAVSAVSGSSGTALSSSPLTSLTFSSLNPLEAELDRAPREDLFSQSERLWGLSLLVSLLSNFFSSSLTVGQNKLECLIKLDLLL